MSKIVWDAVGERKYETGIKKGVLYPQVSGAYPKGVGWNGLTSFEASPDGGEANDFWADDTKYLSLRSRENFKGTLGAYMYPDEFAECDGSAFVANGVKIGQQPRKAFGLSYVSTIGNDTEGEDYGYILHLIWGATVAPSQRTYNTINDNPEPTEMSWEVDTVPTEVGTIGGVTYKAFAHMEIDSTKADATQLAALEDILYGTENTQPYLPLPAAVLAMFGGTSTTYTYTAVENPTGNPTALGYYVRSGNDFILSTDTTVIAGTTYYTRSST